MRIHWKRPRFKIAYLALAVFVGTLTLLVITRRVDEDEGGIGADSSFQGSNRFIRRQSAGHDPHEGHQLPPAGGGGGIDDGRGGLRETVNEDSQELVPGPKEYSGPFPDSQVVEGVQLQLVDYHNYTQQQLDKARTGLGEQGHPAKVPSGMEAEEERGYKNNGFNGLLSDYIALDRAVPDIRHPTCASYKYFADLPTVSVVIPFFEEQLSALQRTVVSVINRSPKHLLKEIILVDDGSTTRPELNTPLEEWLLEHAPLGRVLRMRERQGLITARQAGAREAVGDVILVLDSHCEVMTNWLPPLLNPIAENYRTAVCPLIDIISWDTFAYRIQDNGARGGFDWHFFYKRIPLSPQEAQKLPQPFANPVMNGGLFAISRKFFWELGGYDPGLAIWGGEQYDLSFKVWQCGGRMLDAPCSRVGHVFRGTASNRPAAKQKNFINKNYKRVALVWMDEYIESLYKKKPEMRRVDAGDITGELAVREKLQCKSFKWFLENVAPDLVEHYPPFEDPDFANGTLKNLQNGQCLDTASRNTGEPILHSCHGGSNQQFAWCFRETIRIPSEQFCLEAAPSAGHGPTLYNCNNIDTPSKQKWKYNPYTRLLMNEAKNQCLEAVSSSQLLMTTCSEGNTKQQWDFQHVNIDRIRKVFPDLR